MRTGPRKLSAILLPGDRLAIAAALLATCGIADTESMCAIIEA